MDLNLNSLIKKRVFLRVWSWALTFHMFVNDIVEFVDVHAVLFADDLNINLIYKNKSGFPS